MVLIQDTREKAGKHRSIENYCTRHGIELVRKKLDVGDYMLPDGTVSVDTKYGLAEVYNNLISGHDRFRRECIRARESGIRLVILVEQTGIKTLSDVKEWENPRVTQWNWAVEHGYKPLAKSPPVSSARLYGIMRTMEENYGIRFLFCSKRSTGKKIVEILTEGEKE